MTPKELAAARDLLARAKLTAGKKLPPAQLRNWTPEREAAGDAALEALRRATDPNRKRRRQKYPVPGRTSIVECPVHQLAVALNDDGRICSQCPACRREAEAALEAMTA